MIIIYNMSILDPNTLTKYIDPLPIPQPLKPSCIDNESLKKICCQFCAESDCDFFTDCQDKRLYVISMREGFHKLHSQIPPTKLWTYNGADSSLLIENIRFNDTYVLWKNELPLVHLLAADIDHNLSGAGTDVPDVRNVVHMHGGEQSPTSDGGPLEWFVPGRAALYHYPNHQLPTMLFWHDHAMGITRLNNYAGLAGGVYMIRDPAIESGLNLPWGAFEVPLVLTDKTVTTNGQLYYQGGTHMWQSHFLGNMILVNNKVWPFLNVQPVKYRLRIVNASDTRTYGLKLLKAPLIGAAPNYPGSTPGPFLVQIGSDGGYLPKPIVLTDSVIIGIGERIDVIVDFSSALPGTEFILINNAKGTFPNGNTPNANTSQVMKFRVMQQTIMLPRFSIQTPNNFISLDPQMISVRRQLILNTFPFAGGSMPTGLFLNNAAFMNPVTENPYLGAVELWNLVNVTEGMHPIHLHLIQFQLLDRQQYRLTDYRNDLLAQNPDMVAGEGIPNPLDVTPYLVGSPVSSINTNEYAWKDVIQASGTTNPALGIVTRILVRFAPQIPTEKFPFDATKGRYVWHCHIQSHEDNEMMRPYQLYNCLDGISPAITCDTASSQTEADYVIVGSGAGGALIANKLSACNKNSVIVIEAGSDHDNDSLISESYNAMILPMNYISQFFWTNGPTIPQSNVNDRTFDYTGGRLLGGSTSINGLQYVRGTKELFECWQTLLDDDDYGPDNVHRLYTEFENYTGPATTVRGTCGPMDIRASPEVNITPAMAVKFVNATTIVTGLPEIVDYNDFCTPIGPFVRWQLYQHCNGTRTSASIAFLEPIITRSNGNIAHGDCNHKGLTILFKTTALRILWHKNRAKGVLALQNGECVSIKARKKVIVCAGIMSPTLLLHSGVGPACELQRLGIPVVFDNHNVGFNTSNQSFIMMTLTSNPTDMGMQRLQDLYVGGAFLPDPSSGNKLRGIQLIGLNPTAGTMNIIIIPLFPKSTGSVQISSSDPLTSPVTNMNYLADPADMATLKASIKLVADIINQMSIVDPSYQLIDPDPTILNNDSLLAEFIRDNLDQNHHWCGSNRMATDCNNGVVSSSGSVFGVENLIVADATVLPTQTAGNTSAPTYIVANIIADKLLRKHEKN